MKKIKLIALDLDGTLLDSEKRLSSKNEAVLKECIRRGIEIVPCTGRIWIAVPEFLQKFPGIHYAITVNGAVVENVAEKKVLDEKMMTCEKAMEMIDFARGFNTMYDAYASGRGYGEERFIGRMTEFGIAEHLQSMIHNTRTMVPDLKEQLRSMGRPVEKLNYFFGDMEERKRVREILMKRDDILVSSAMPYNLEINALGATKGEALMRLAEHLGLNPEETMGFGDGENDLTMIRDAGIGVAMRNGIDLLRENADYVTLTNDEDGVADAIEKLVLQNC